MCVINVSLAKQLLCGYKLIYLLTVYVCTAYCVDIVASSIVHMF